MPSRRTYAITTFRAVFLAASLAAGAPLRAEVVRELMEGGKVFREYSIDERGELDGAFRENHPNGAARIKALYVKGKLHGNYELYDERGKLVRTSIYLHGMLAYPLLPQEVRAALKQMDDTAPRVVFEERPSATAPFSAGRLSAPALTAAVMHMRRYRFLCGLAYEDLGIKERYVTLAQHAAVLLEALGRLDHQPPKVPGMTDDFYAKALEGAQRSNLHQGQGSLLGAIDAFMFDSDARNISHLGHRRWILNPPMAFTGMGQSGGYVALYVQDSSLANVPDYDFVPFPPRGYIPARYITREHAWSISLNTGKYAIPNDAQVKVAIAQLDRQLAPTGTALAHERFVVSRQSYGIPLCIIFSPVFTTGFNGQRFLVDVQGVTKSDPKAADVRYVVEIGGQ